MTAVDGSVDDFELLADLTARLASTARLDDVVDTVVEQIVALGFGAVWMAVVDEPTGNLVTLKEVIDGVDTTHEMPKIFMLDMRQPIGQGFRERRMINIVDPDSLHIIERGDEAVPPGRLALPRIIYEHMRGHPFACGPLLGSRGQPVGALGLSSFRGRQPIPDELMSRGLLRAFMAHLGIAMERALHVARLEALNADLLKAQAAIVADARIKAIGELAAAVAHDLNNLCGIALMAVSVGLRSPNDAATSLPRIERANRAIGDLVARLQRVARPASRSIETAQVEQIIDDIVVMVRPLLAERSIRLDVELPAMPAVHCDPTLVHQVILNLVMNAQDAIAEMSIERRRLCIGVERVGERVHVAITDSGPGIAPDVLAKLFQPFVTTKGGAHVGLGLAAAHASLKHFGGELHGRNAADGGAIFEVVLPIAPATDVEDAAPAVVRGTTRRIYSVLAVDDDPDVVEIIRTYLEPLGFDVTTSMSGDDALSLAATRAFDVVLCDVGMPKRSGLDVCSALRESGFHGKLVLMTGWDSHIVERDRRAANCDTVIAKPFVGAELVEVIESLLPS